MGVSLTDGDRERTPPGRRAFLAAVVVVLAGAAAGLLTERADSAPRQAGPARTGAGTAPAGKP
jgi:hypothetical protein